MPQIGDVKITGGKLFSTPGASGFEGQVANNVQYILDLEYGSSTQAPTGMLRINMARIRQLAQVELEAAMRTYSDPAQALEAAVTFALMGAERLLVLATPVDTGRAKGAWRRIGPYPKKD